MAKPETSIFEEIDDALDEARLAEAEADIAAGRVMPHEEVSKWLLTWGTPDEGPLPAHWFNS